MAARNACLVATAVEVLCPYCSEPQPNEQGSEFWEIADFKDEAIGPKNCVSCDKVLNIQRATKAHLVF